MARIFKKICVTLQWRRPLCIHVIFSSSQIHTEELMIDENSVNAQQISECAVKKLKSYMCGQLLRRF